MNVTLIGMAAAGKSHIGRQIAEPLSLEFVDVDELLEDRYQKPIQALLDETGEEKYLDLEAQMFIDTTKGRDNLLIAPGGSIIYRDDAMRHARDIGNVVYIKVPFDVIAERKRGAAPRAVIGQGQKTLADLYESRQPLYEKYADLTIEPMGLTLEDILLRLRDFLHSRK